MKDYKKQRFNQMGFTLIELLVVTSIIGLLSSIIIVSVVTARRNGRDTVTASNIRTLVNAFQVYSGNNGDYPTVPYSYNGGAITGGVDICSNVASCNSASSFAALASSSLISHVPVPPNPEYGYLYMHRIDSPTNALSIQVNCTLLAPTCTNMTSTSCNAYMLANNKAPDGLPKAALFFTFEKGLSQDYACIKALDASCDLFNGNAVCLW